MKNLILLTLFMVIAFVSISQSVIGVTGGEGIVGNMNINYTVGEIAIATISNDSTILSQGFHQPSYVITSIKESFLLGEVKIYPNPTASTLQVQFESIELRNLMISIHDFSGRIIRVEEVHTDNWQWDLSDLPAGSYLLTIADILNSRRNSYKIIKSN